MKPSLKFPARVAQSKEKPAISKKLGKPAPSMAAFKSAEYVQESDEEGQEISERENESDSDHGSLPSNSTDAITTSNSKLQRPAGRISPGALESEESGSEVDDEDEEEEKPGIAARKTSAVTEPAKKSMRAPSVGEVRSQKPFRYNPPSGFENDSLSGTLKSAQSLRKVNLEGKEIWYFTAPASLSLSSIKQMSLKDAKAGQAILNHKGNEYGLIRDSAEDKTYTKIMVPHSDDGYRMTKKSIDYVFHLQQIVKLPGTHDFRSITAGSAKARVPAKRPIKPQPQALKMRFRPIGFGDGDIGKIGSSSSSVDESSAESVSDEEMDEAPAFRRPSSVASDSSEEEGSSEDSRNDQDYSSSDVEMTEAPPLPIKPAMKDKRVKVPATIASPDELKNGSLKGKHGEGEDRKLKYSSPRPSSFHDRELERLKKKQTESQSNSDEQPSGSIELHKSPTQQLSAKTDAISSQKHTPIRPPKSTILSSSSRVSRASQVFTGRDEQRSSEKAKSKKHDHSESETPARKNGLSVQDLTQATERSLPGEGRTKKTKKLKHNE